MVEKQVVKNSFSKVQSVMRQFHDKVLHTILKLLTVVIIFRFRIAALSFFQPFFNLDNLTFETVNFFLQLLLITFHVLIQS